jgi:hypothetical protein
MIQYHVMSLLFLAIAAITAIEALARFYGTPAEPNTQGWANPLGWLMVALCGICIFMYFRVRKIRKRKLYGNK